MTHAGGNSGLGHMLKIKANVSGKDVLFIFDTGIGVNIISKALCLELGCQISGSVTGKRMTGQEVTVPMTKVQSLEVAGIKSLDVDMGVLDFNGFLPAENEFENVHGYLSLNFFENQAFTVDYTKNLLVIEDHQSLNERLEKGEIIPISKKRQGAALTINMPIKAQINKTLDMQLDLGTNIMTINDEYIDDFEKYFDKDSLKKESMTDETGHNRNRVYVKLNGKIAPPDTTKHAQNDPTVMFQKIIYDGVIGNDYFKGKIVTYDLANSRLILN